jgi:hypothetical protein
LVEDASDEEEAETEMDVFVEDPMDVMIPAVGLTQPVSDIKALFSSSKFTPNFTMQKKDSSSHQNIGTCMEY